MAANSKVLWINDMSGSVNQGTAPHFLADNQFKLLVNMDQNEIGGIGHRLGTTKLGSASGASNVQGLHTLNQSGGSRYFHLAAGGNLYRLTLFQSIPSLIWVWTLQESSVWDSSSTVDMTTFIDRHYMIGSGATEYLRYATGSGSTTVVSGNITGDYLATNGPYLMVADAANRKAYASGVAAGTFDTATDYVNINGRATGIGSFGNGRPFIVFTEDNYLIVDPANDFASDEVNGFGCTSHRTIQNVRGHLVWVGRDGIFRLALNDTFPVEISRPIRNLWSKNAFFDLIPGVNLDAAASAVIDNRYFCWVRGLETTMFGYTLTNPMIEYDIAMDTLKFHTFGADAGLGVAMANYVTSELDGTDHYSIYAGSEDAAAVYRLFPEDTFTDENSSAVTSSVTGIAITKDYSFYDGNKGVISKNNVLSLHFKYYASSALTIKYSLDGATTYTTLDRTLAATSAGLGWCFKEIAFGKECKSISLDISGTGKFILYGIGFEIDSKNNTGITLT